MRSHEGTPTCRYLSRAGVVALALSIGAMAGHAAAAPATAPSHATTDSTVAATSDETVAPSETTVSLRPLAPTLLKGRIFLTLEYWQWVGLLIAIFLAVVADFLSRQLLATIVRRSAHRHLGDPSDASVRYTVRPMSLAIGSLSFILLISLLGLPEPTSTILFVTGRVLLIVGLTWAAWSLTDLVSNILLTRAKATETAFDDMFIPLLRKTIKLFLMALATIYFADTFNVALAPLLGGLGLAGLAVSFAAQDLVKNLFGGIMIFLDRPFKIGERIKFQDYDGMIEEIGFRTIRLRTLTGHLVTIPNGSITNEAVENIGRRPFIRRALHVTITYDTPRPKIEEAVTIIRDILQEEGIREPIHPVIGGDEYPPRVYFSDFGSTSLDITVLYWHAPPAYWDYLEHAQRFNLRLFEAFAQAGIEFAFPTQTVFLAGDPQRELAVRMAAKEENR